MAESDPVDETPVDLTEPLVVSARDTWATVAQRAGCDADDLISVNGSRHRPLIVGEELHRP